MRITPLLLAALLLAAPVVAVSVPAVSAQAADAPITAEAFEALSVGRTLTYSLEGKVYGTEQYLLGRRVLWAFEGDECRTGLWFEDEGRICFVYDQASDPQCWTYFRDAGGLKARFAGDPPGSEAAAVAEIPGPMDCPGPQVGV
jgi:hypothetical protein